MKRMIENPQVIELSELPDSGREYMYDRESAELNEALSDVLQSNPYKIQLFMEKIGNAFQATGQINCQMDLQCSRCGDDIKVPQSLAVREIIMVQAEMPRTGKTARVNHSTELDPLGPDCVFLDQPQLNVGEFIREIIVLNEPLKPLCEKGCENPYLAALSKKNEELEAEKSPFSVLKDYKLNS